MKSGWLEEHKLHTDRNVSTPDPSRYGSGWKNWKPRRSTPNRLLSQCGSMSQSMRRMKRELNSRSEGCGLQAPSDRQEGTHNKIDDQIIAEIRRSRFVVCDFTCELIEYDGKQKAFPRGGVYYEAGFAQGLGIPVIWMCRADHIEHVHFDTRQFNHITWSTPEELREKLRNRIGAVIGDGPLKDR